MIFSKNKTACLFLILLSSLLLSTVIFAVDKRELDPAEKGSFESSSPTPPERENGFYKPNSWGNDVTIRTGPTENGISIDHNAGDTLFAVSCSTYGGVDNAYLGKYMSVNGGNTWSKTVHSIYSIGATYSYPVILTGSVGWKIYLFYLSSYENGCVKLRRFTQDGYQSTGYSDPMNDEADDTITYFTACTDMGQGNYLMIVYQREIPGDPTPNLYATVSTDQGETWSDQGVVSYDGAHPDMAYGSGGYVYLVYETTAGTDREIYFKRSNNYCASGSWEYSEALTTDSHDDTYPKIAALHTFPPSSPSVWVAYNHDYNSSGNINLRYAYSSNGGVDWDKDNALATSSDYDEMACDLWVKRSAVSTTVNICYLKYKTEGFPPTETSEIWFRTATSATPTSWSSAVKISDYRAALSQDGRKVCQGTYNGSSLGILYAGKPYFPANFEKLYFDLSSWTDVGDDIAEDRLSAQFYLSANYPNPFNPVTRIEFRVKSLEFRDPIHTTLKVYNVMGQLVRTLVDEPKEPGTYEVIWDGRDENGNQVASGVYFYRLDAGDFTQTKKMVLMK
jgi:hypothetical protein